MIDIELIRTDKEKVKASEKNRFRDPQRVDLIFDMDVLWRKKRHELDELNKKINALQDNIKNVVKMKKTVMNVEEKLSDIRIDGGDTKNTNNNTTKNTSTTTTNNMPEMIKERSLLKQQKDTLTLELSSLQKDLHKNLKSIGNILDPAVPISNTEDDNLLIREHRSERKTQGKILNYAEIFEKVQGVDTKRGARISGHRGYFLKEEMALLGNALSSYAIDFMRERGYVFMQTPVFMQESIMSKTAQLSDFSDQLYSTNDNNFLIATSEQPLSAYHMDENIFTLPLKYVGQSLCFRREAGAHGKDNAGIFRVHQFEKIEQFVLCAPEDSPDMFNNMITTVEEFYQSLGLSYKVIAIVSGELNDAACLKYDLEAYFPSFDKYRELVSCSNCTDYQSRDLNVRSGYGKKDEKKIFVHMLNCTVVAVQRALCCLVENYQCDDGVLVPDVLRKYYNKHMIYYKD